MNNKVVKVPNQNGKTLALGSLPPSSPSSALSLLLLSSIRNQGSSARCPHLRWLLCPWLGGARHRVTSCRRLCSRRRVAGCRRVSVEGKCLTQNILKKKPKKGSKNAKPITKTENCESFFNFFNPPQVPEDDEDIDEDMAEELQNQMEQDYDIGSTIRDKIIPHAVSWFTGEAIQGEEFGDLED
ncbi:nucleosome assembly protein 1;3-like, partial [Arachis ipaensis]|uniref:nucleosome assembly protein 1;3-like n=1 Tax=Arachis ipaensis TaxID=130454 RepID=UPI000A2B8BC6